jgi:hypothetical protein
MTPVTGLLTRARNRDRQARDASADRYAPAGLVHLQPAPTAGRRRPKRRPDRWHKLADHVGQPAPPGRVARLARHHHPPRTGRIQHRPGHHAWAARQDLAADSTRPCRRRPGTCPAASICSPANTVKTHLRHLYRKLGAYSRQEAVQRARATGLLTPPSRRP